MKRAEAKHAKSETATAAKRAAAPTVERLGYVEWDAVRARIKRLPESDRDAAWTKVASALSTIAYG